MLVKKVIIFKTDKENNASLSKVNIITTDFVEDVDVDVEEENYDLGDD